MSLKLLCFDNARKVLSGRLDGVDLGVTIADMSDPQSVQNFVQLQIAVFELIKRMGVCDERIR